MPQFFKMDELTPEQQANFEIITSKYNEIQALNATGHSSNKIMTEEDKKNLEFMRLIHQPGTKSALFARLLEGKKALKFPPPCSYSYPWYEIIEENKKYEIHSDNKIVDDFLFSYNQEEEKKIIIDQTGWNLIEKLSEKEAIITYPGWSNLGFKWKLSYETISTKDSTSFIIPHHEPLLKRITTLDQLYKEQKHHVELRITNLKNTLEPQLIEAAREECIQKYGVEFGSGIFSQQLEQSKKEIESRIHMGLTAIPTEEEILKMVEKKVQDYLNRNYEANEKGELFVKTWILERIYPNIIPNIYID